MVLFVMAVLLSRGLDVVGLSVYDELPLLPILYWTVWLGDPLWHWFFQGFPDDCHIRVGRITQIAVSCQQLKFIVWQP